MHGLQKNTMHFCYLENNFVRGNIWNSLSNRTLVVGFLLSKVPKSVHLRHGLVTRMTWHVFNFPLSLLNPLYLIRLS